MGYVKCAIIIHVDGVMTKAQTYLTKTPGNGFNVWGNKIITSLL